MVQVRMICCCILGYDTLSMHIEALHTLHMLIWEACHLSLVHCVPFRLMDNVFLLGLDVDILYHSFWGHAWSCYTIQRIHQVLMVWLSASLIVIPILLWMSAAAYMPCVLKVPGMACFLLWLVMWNCMKAAYSWKNLLLYVLFSLSWHSAFYQLLFGPGMKLSTS